MGLFCDKIKKARNADNVNLNSIGLASLEKHFTNKCSYNNDTENDIIMNARKEVTAKLKECPFKFTDITITQERVTRYIRRLKPGGAPGDDKITPEHVKLAIDSDIYIFVTYLPIVLNMELFQPVLLKEY